MSSTIQGEVSTVFPVSTNNNGFTIAQHITNSFLSYQQFPNGYSVTARGNDFAVAWLQVFSNNLQSVVLNRIPRTGLSSNWSAIVLPSMSTSATGIISEGIAMSCVGGTDLVVKQTSSGNLLAQVFTGTGQSLPTPATVGNLGSSPDIQQALTLSLVANSSGYAALGYTTGSAQYPSRGAARVISVASEPAVSTYLSRISRANTNVTLTISGPAQTLIFVQSSTNLKTWNTTGSVGSSTGITTVSYPSLGKATFYRTFVQQ
jgi:hypothetical protein